MGPSGQMLMTRILACVLVSLVVACFSPRLGDYVPCSLVEDCPEGRTCLDNRCTIVAIDAHQVPDAIADADADAHDAYDASPEPVADASGCESGYSDCSGMCTYLATDPDHCGSCTRSCPSGVCSVGRCLEYFGRRTGANGTNCTPNSPGPSLPSLRETVNVPYPILVQKLGVVIRSDGVPPYQLKLFPALAGNELAATPTFAPQGFNVAIERDIVNAP